MVHLEIIEGISPFQEIESPSLYSLPTLKSYPHFSTLCDHLSAYNTSIGCQALDSIEKLRGGAPCVVTGQQLGFMGGPSYTILKGISTLLLARELDAVPIFWLATEDHDLAEINHTYLLNSRGDLNRYRLKLPQKPFFVEDLLLNQEHLLEVGRFAAAIEIKIPLPRQGERYAQAMAKLMAFLFRDTPMIFVEPYLFRPFSQPFILEQMIQAQKLESLLVQQTSQLAITPIIPQGPSHLFFKTKGGLRRRIILSEGRYGIESESYSLEEMVNLLNAYPERFSCGVVARPLLQSYHLPVLAYVAGPSEIHYLAQLKSLFAHQGIPEPLVIPRISATILPSKATEILSRSGLNPWEPLPKSWKQWEGAENSDLDRILEERGIPYHGLHFLSQLLHPHDHWQERVLNWFLFEKEGNLPLVQHLLTLIDWRERGHHYVYL